MSREEHRITEKQEASNGGAKHPWIREEETQDSLPLIDFPGHFL